MPAPIQTTKKCSPIQPCGRPDLPNASGSVSASPFTRARSKDRKFKLLLLYRFGFCLSPSLCGRSQFQLLITFDYVTLGPFADYDLNHPKSLAPRDWTR